MTSNTFHAEQQKVWGTFGYFWFRDGIVLMSRDTAAKTPYYRRPSLREQC